MNLIERGLQMVSFVFEIIADFIFEVSYDSVLNKKGPRWLRAILIIFILALFMGILAVFLFLGISFIKKEETFMGAMLILVGIILSGLFIRRIKKDIKERQF